MLFQASDLSGCYAAVTHSPISPYTKYVCHRVTYVKDKLFKNDLLVGSNLSDHQLNTDAVCVRCWPQIKDMQNIKRRNRSILVNKGSKLWEKSKKIEEQRRTIKTTKQVTKWQ